MTVSVDDEHATDVQGVAERLEAVGLAIEELFEELGVIVGRIDPARADGLREVEGVESVERSREYQLPPPEAEIQ